MKEKTSWETSSSWYDKIVGDKGHYYHEQVILPQVHQFLKNGPREDPLVLDLACGQGVLSRHLPKGISYLGVDSSPSLIAAAKAYSREPHCQFLVRDLSQPVKLPVKNCSHATLILAAQNFSDPTPVFHTTYAHLRNGGQLMIVMNHPCFRIPRQSSWGVDKEKKLQYRRIDRYLSPLTIPIQTHPGKKEEQVQTLSFHHPLSFFVRSLSSSGFVIITLEEWCSNKNSVGKQAPMENRCRQEFPLFLALVCKKMQ